MLIVDTQRGDIVNKIILTLATFIFASSAYADKRAIELSVDLSLNGKHVMSPTIHTLDGEKTTVTSGQGEDRTYIEVVATQKLLNNKRAVVMNFVVGTFAADGSKTVLSSASLITRDSNRGEIQSIDKATGESVVISAKPTIK